MDLNRKCEKLKRPRSHVVVALSFLSVLLPGCGIMENAGDYQYLSGPNGWSGNTSFDDSKADVYFEVACASMTVSRDPAVNREALAGRVRGIKAVRPEVQIVLFGETITGWYLGGSDTASNRQYQDSIAETVPGPTSDTMGALSKELGIYIAFGIAQRTGEGLYNSLVLVNPAGAVQAVHHKYLTVHSTVVAPLDYPYLNGTGTTVTRINGVPFGLIVCNDMHSLTVAQGMCRENVRVVLSALSDKSKAPEQDGWSPLSSIYNAWVVQANRAGSEGKETYPGAMSVIDPAGRVRASKNGDGWIAARIGVYR
jgi:predicted amidohydrolase